MTDTPRNMKKVPQYTRFSNPVPENIYARRSVRKFTSESVPEEVVEEILRAGTYAPNGGNRQRGVLS